MQGIFWLFMKSEYRKHLLMYLKQCLYFVPIIAIILVLSSTQNIKYFNQRDFYENVKYESIDISDVKEQNSFELYDACIAVVEDVRGVIVYDKQYRCELFNVPEGDIDYEITYFNKENMHGFDINSLKEDEVIISYDVAKKLKVNVGDIVTFISDDSETHVNYHVGHIMKTKYKYDQIGNVGTILLKQKENSTLMEMYGSPLFYTFSQSKGGDIEIDEEIRECSIFNLPTASVVVTNVIFPVLGILLLFILVSREVKNVKKKMNYNLSVLFSMGMNTKVALRAVLLVEWIVLIISAICAIILYKYVFIQGMIGQYLSVSAAIKYWGIVVFVAWITVYLHTRFLKHEINKMDLIIHLNREEE